MSSLLFLYGPTGAGKTRLLQLITERCKEQSIKRVGCEQVVDEMYQALEDENAGDFFDAYSSIKNLLLDNLWTLQRRPVAAKNLGELIKSRVAKGNLTILASDLPCDDVMHVIPDIGECLKENKALHLKLAKDFKSTSNSASCLAMLVALNAVEAAF